MLIRIVRMSFNEDKVDEFLRIFNEHKQYIRNFDGCTHLELLKDPDNPTIYATLSHWKNSESLTLYRKSELFNKVWSIVKLLFSDKPQALSFEKLMEC